MSRNNEATDPAFALTLNPFNSEAAVNLVVTAINAEADPDLASLTLTARQMISASPADARGYSLLGAVEERTGNRAKAQSLYGIALEHSKSELHALLRTTEARLQSSDTAGALENIDLLLRRWPSYWDQVAPFVRGVAADANAAPLLADQMNHLPPWRGQAIAALAKEPSTLRFLRGLISSAPPTVRERPAWTAERDAVVAALVYNGAASEAYTLFLTSLTPREAAVAGYIFDGGFNLPPSRGYFGWRLQRPGATEIRLGVGAEVGVAGLRVHFLDSPARPGIVSQNLMLPFGTYRLSVDASTASLRAPKELFWSVKCAEGDTLARLPVGPGTSSGTELQVNFEVPGTGCSRQVLSLDTAVRTDSWRDRYEGEVRFSNLVITRL